MRVLSLCLIQRHLIRGRRCNQKTEVTEKNNKIEEILNEIKLKCPGVISCDNISCFL